MQVSTKRIRRLRAERSLTLSELSEISGVSRSTLSSVEHCGSCYPTTAGKIARALGVRVEEIEEEEVKT